MPLHVWRVYQDAKGFDVAQYGLLRGGLLKKQMWLSMDAKAHWVIILHRYGISYVLFDVWGKRMLNVGRQPEVEIQVVCSNIGAEQH